MYALARKMVFGLVATTLVIGTAHVAMAKPPKLQPWPHYYHGPMVVCYPVNPVPAEIQLINPAANQVALRYVLNGGPVQLLPAGSSVSIHQQSVVGVDRGGASGWGRYSLTGGVYKFIPANGAWTLVCETSESVTSDVVASAANPGPANRAVGPLAALNNSFPTQFDRKKENRRKPVFFLCPTCLATKDCAAGSTTRSLPGFG